MEQYKLPLHINPDKVFIINRSELGGRIDPYFFKKEFDVISDKLSQVKILPLKKASIKIFSGITPLSGGDSYTDRENGIAFIRSGDYSEDNIIDFASTNYITPLVHNGIMSSSKIKKGDLLIAIVGATIGKVGIYNYNEEANINQAICAIRLKEQFLPEFIHIYLLTTLGQKILDRLKRPVARANINLEEISSIQIPQITQTRQKEVVDFYYNKISLKQQKESQAKTLLNSIDIYLLNELGITLPEKDNSLQKRVFATQFSDITGGRLDTQLYFSEFVELNLSIQTVKNSPLKNIINFSKEAWNQVDYFETEFPYIEISEINLDTGDIMNISYIDKQEAPSRAKMIVREHDIIISTTRPSRGAISIIKKELDLSIASTGFAVIRKINKKEVQLNYLYEVLRSEICLKQMEQRSSGGNYPAITIEELGKILIPLPSLQKQNEIAQHIQSIRKQAKQLQNDAKMILEQAKIEVEKMILG